jgi:3-hydroxymyristoyl/3-hydroxydecanoyl-(acyl carrier protein) dehydratase
VLELNVEMLRYRKGRFGKAKGVASVAGDVTCEGELSFAIGDEA